MENAKCVLLLLTENTELLHVFPESNSLGEESAWKAGLMQSGSEGVERTESRETAAEQRISALQRTRPEAAGIQARRRYGYYRRARLWQGSRRRKRVGLAGAPGRFEGARAPHVAPSHLQLRRPGSKAPPQTRRREEARLASEDFRQQHSRRIAVPLVIPVVPLWGSFRNDSF